MLYNVVCWRDSSPKNENSVIIYSSTCRSKSVWVSYVEDILKNADNQTVDGPHWLP